MKSLLRITIGVWVGIVLLTFFSILFACATPIEPCEIEARAVARYEDFTVVCRIEFKPTTLTETALCLIYPIPPDSLAWLGSVAEMEKREIEFTTHEVCTDEAITETGER